MKLYLALFLTFALIVLALLRPQKANAQHHSDIALQDCGLLCAGNTFEGRDVFFKMKTIPLTRGMFAIVDDEDYVELAKYKWNYMGYAVRNIPNPNGRHPQKRAFMHRVIMNPPDGMDVDHANGNKIDNRRCNLRICSRSQNCTNSKIRSDNTWGHKGIRFHRPSGKFQARIVKNKKRVSLGYFLTLQEASAAYVDAAKINYGEFAKPFGI